MEILSLISSLFITLGMVSVVDLGYYILINSKEATSSPLLSPVTIGTIAQD